MQPITTILVLAFVRAQPPPGGGGGGGGGGSSNPHAVPALGAIGFTTTDVLAHKEWMSTAPGHAGEDIYGLFEAGFGPQQDHALESLGCQTPSDGYLAAGFDTVTAESMIAYQCGIDLPRFDGDDYVSLLDLCGGHTHQYHFHERLSCLYDVEPGHSPQVGELLDDAPVYGEWEDTDAYPALDACGAHFGVTPDSGGQIVYHYHVQETPPFIAGCYGPSDAGTEVSLEECRSYYPDECGDDVTTVTLADGTTHAYDPWCPCFNKAGLNDGTPDPDDDDDDDEDDDEDDAVATAAPTPRPTREPTRAPTPRPTPRPTTPADDDACFDVADWRRFKNGKVKANQDCAWLEDDKGATRSRCNKYQDADGVAAATACCACRAFDDPPAGCADDADWRRAKNGVEKAGKSCEWLSDKGATKTRCANYVDAAGVPAQTACGCVCGDFA